nr:MAG TPA: hypothetical protein [Caudoviricetes sp.]
MKGGKTSILIWSIRYASTGFSIGTAGQWQSAAQQTTAPTWLCHDWRCRSEVR